MPLRFDLLKPADQEEKIEVTYPTVSDLERAVAVLSERDMDFAREENGIGWNGSDTQFGHILYDKIGHWSPKMWALAHKMVQKYQKQILAATGIDVKAIPVPSSENMPDDAAKVNDDLYGIRMGDRKFLIHIHKEDAEIRLRIKACKGWQYKPTNFEWSVPDDDVNRLKLAEMVNEFGLPTDDESGAILESLRNAASLSRAKRERLLKLSSQVDPVELSDIPGFRMDLLNDRPWETVAVQYMIEAMSDGLGCIEGDEQRVGKSPSALATVMALDAKPCIIVCSASTKIQWQRQVNLFCPRSKVAMLKGRTPQPLMPADFYIINYDVVYFWLDELAKVLKQAKHRGSIIADEAQKIKGDGFIWVDPDDGTKVVTGVRRAAALLWLSELDSHPYCIELSGTISMNKATEWIVPLKFTGRMNQLGGRARVEWYCGSNDSARWGGASSAYELRRLHEFNQELRSVCYVRRLYKEVKPGGEPLPPIVVPVEISNRAEYAYAEREFLKWLMETAGNEAAMKAMKAQILVKLNKLRELVGKGKIEPTAEWMEDFLSETDEKFIIFAHHREVQYKLWDKANRIGIEQGFSAARIEGGVSDSQRQPQIDAFQTNPSTRIAVVSALGGSEGLTLSKARATVHTEYGWNPAMHAQADFRAVGEQAPQPYYISAEGTIDDEMIERIQRKQAITTAVNQGLMVDEPDDSLISNLIEGIVKRNS